MWYMVGSTLGYGDAEGASQSDLECGACAALCVTACEPQPQGRDCAFAMLLQRGGWRIGRDRLSAVQGGLQCALPIRACASEQAEQKGQADDEGQGVFHVRGRLFCGGLFEGAKVQGAVAGGVTSFGRRFTSAHAALPWC